MSDAAIHDYLTQQIKVNRNIVTFRLLSRALSIHINDAKSALATFYETNKASHGDQPLHATYLISGEDLEAKDEDSAMDVDSAQPVIDGPSRMAEPVPRTKMMIVQEENLESSKSLFKVVTGVHVYSIEPSRFMDPALLVTTVDAVRKMDADRSTEELQKLGIPISAACKYNSKLKAKPKASAPAATMTKATTSKTVPTTNTTSTKAPAEKVKKEPEEKLPPKKPSKTESAAKSTASTGLNWGKAKKTENSTAPAKKVASQETGKNTASQGKSKGKEPAPSDSSDVPSEPKPKRGIKRPSPPSEDEGSESRQPPKAKARRSSPAIRTKNRVLLSDDEEDSEPVRKPVRSKSKSEAAIMDWSDDENVIVANRHTPGPPSSRGDGDDEDDEGTENTSRDEDAMDTTDGGIEEPKYAKVNRAPKKKTWPIGSNGLRKKRVVKTREYKDAKNYLQTEDYSDYESVNSASEEPPEPGTQKKATKKAKEAAKPSIKKEEIATPLPKQGSFKQSSAPAKPKQSSSQGAGGKKKTLDSFFAKK